MFPAQPVSWKGSDGRLVVAARPAPRVAHAFASHWPATAAQVELLGHPSRSDVAFPCRPSVQSSVHLDRSHPDTARHDLAQPRAPKTPQARACDSDGRFLAQRGTTWPLRRRGFESCTAHHSSPASSGGKPRFRRDLGSARRVCAIQCAIGSVTTWHGLAHGGTATP